MGSGPKTNARAGGPAEHRPVLIVGAGIVALAAALYLPTIGYPFQWDDELLLGGRVGALDAESIQQAFRGHFLKLITDEDQEIPYYRPASLALLIGERWLFGTRPGGYRAVHALLHLLAVLLAGLVYRAALTGWGGLDRRQATWSAGYGVALLLVLPYSVDAVLFVTNVGDLLVLAWIALALLAFERFLADGRAPWLLGLLLAAALAASSKETGVVTPALLALRLLLAPGGGLARRALIGIGAAAAGAALFMVLRAVLLDGPASLDPLVALRRLPADLAVAARWAMAPHPLALREPVPGLELGAWWWAGLGLLALLAAAAWRWRRRRPLATVAIAAWLLLLAPSLIGLQGSLVFAPRYLYLPAAALGLGGALLFGTARRVLRVALIAVLVALLPLAALRLDAWSDDETLWTLEVERHPEQALGLINLGRAVERRGRKDEAAELYRRAITAAVADGQALYGSLAHTNYGRLRDEHFGDPAGALEHLATAARLFPTEEAWLVTGIVHAHGRDYPAAIAAFEQALALAPDSYQGHLSLAGALAAVGRLDEAIAHLDRSAELAAGSPEARALVAERRALLNSARERRGSGAGGAIRSR